MKVIRLARIWFLKERLMTETRAAKEQRLLGRWLMQMKAKGLSATPELTMVALEAIRMTLDECQFNNLNKQAKRDKDFTSLRPRFQSDEPGF